MRLIILRGVKGEGNRLKFSEQGKAGKGGKKKKNLDKNNHQNQTISSNSSGNVQCVIYGGEEMALLRAVTSGPCDLL